MLGGRSKHGLRQTKLPTHQSIAGERKVFAQLSYAYITSDAFKCLKPTSLRMLIGMELERFNHGIKAPSVEEPEAGYKVNDFYFPYTYASKVYGINSNRGFTDGIADLEEKGFIDIVRHGSRAGNQTGSSHKTKSVYRFSERWKEYGADKKGL